MRTHAHAKARSCWYNGLFAPSSHGHRNPLVIVHRVWTSVRAVSKSFESFRCKCACAYVSGDHSSELIPARIAHGHKYNSVYTVDAACTWFKGIKIRLKTVCTGPVVSVNMFNETYASKTHVLLENRSGFTKTNVTF